MREVIVYSVAGVKLYEGVLIEFIAIHNTVYGLIEKPDGSIDSKAINKIKFTYPSYRGC